MKKIEVLGGGATKKRKETIFDELCMAITKNTLLPKFSRYHNDVQNKYSLELDHNSEYTLPSK